MNAFKLRSALTRGWSGVAAMPWEWYEAAEEVADQLRQWAHSGEWREHVIRRYKELAEKILRFQEEYFGGNESTCLGYAVVYRNGGIIVKALVAHGENDVHLEVVDVEEWLREHSDP
jgi:hypothetical protein